VIPRETQFAWSGEAALAYQVLGEGDPPLLYLPGWVSNVELNVGSGLEFEDRGEHALKGVDGPWRLYRVVN
jgi:hypothetical protein